MRDLRNRFGLTALRKRTVVVRALPFLVFVGALILSTLAMKWLPGEANAGVRDWLALSRGVLVAGLLILLWPAYSELRSPNPVTPDRWIAAVIAGLAVFFVWIELHQGGAVMTHSEQFIPLLADGSLDWPKALLRLAGLALVVPVMEELFWRSLVLRWIVKHEFLTVDPARVGLRAFVITTVLFAIEHDAWLAGAIAGVVYNLLYMRSGNLWVPILAHAVTNGALGIWILQTRNWGYW